ncbi:MAG TPA: NfeD family protein [Candidatus Tectomicrobia bacterium]|nr:NfeD family protein [Candidatus Tectomicrobia bacterium]
MRCARRWSLVVALGIVALLAAGLPAPAQAPHVYVLPIDGIIDLGQAPFVERVLREAERTGAAAVVLEVNTLGGRVDAAIQIRDALLNTRTRTIAFINKRAISAGALISLAAETIAMTEGATIGAATPVQLGQGGESQPTSEKAVSYVRKEFRATAEARKRPPLVAEAMVDPDVAIPGLIEKGKLLTLSTTEALEQRIADFRADDLQTVLERAGIAGAEVRRVSPNWAEQVVRFLTHPVFSSVLMTIGILGLIVELRTPGFGVPGAVGIASLAAFFWGHWLVRLVGWEELLLVAIGLLLLAIEIFVTPGFGVLGILGIVAFLAGLALSLVGAGATSVTVLNAAGRVVVSLLVGVAASVVLLRFLPRLPLARRVVLETGLLPGGGGDDADGESRWLGARGTSATPLRPAGIAHLGGERVDVVSQGEYVEAGAPIEVIRVEGNRIVVRRLPEAAGGQE